MGASDLAYLAYAEFCKNFLKMPQDVFHGQWKSQAQEYRDAWESVVHVIIYEHEKGKPQEEPPHAPAKTAAPPDFSAITRSLANGS